MTANPIHAQSQASLTLLGSDSSPPDLASLPPFSFTFTFYAPLEVPPAQYFYSEEPVHRTTERLVEFDEEEWGDQVGIGSGEKQEAREEDDAVNNFIRGAIEGGRMGEASEGSAAEEGRARKRKNDSEDNSLSTDDTDSLRSLKRIRFSSNKSSKEEDRVVKRRGSSVRSNPAPRSTVPDLPFPRALNTSVLALSNYISPDSLSPFLSQIPAPPTHSAEYGLTLLRFFRSVAPNLFDWVPSNHMNVFAPSLVATTGRYIRKWLPDFDNIRKTVPLGNLNRTRESLPGNTNLAFDTVEWIWDRRVRIPELRWVVEAAPLPLLAIVLEHIAVCRYLQAVQHTRKRFVTYVTSSPFSASSTSSARALRARTLVEWLEKGGTTRWERFFTGSTDETELAEFGEERWDWWFYDLEDVGAERERTVEELDVWEKKEIEKRNRSS